MKQIISLFNNPGEMMKKLLLFLPLIWLPAAGFAQTSGESGDCTWTLAGTSGNRTLTLTGNGAMGDYGTAGLAPWDPYRNDITAVILRQGVTSIGVAAFFTCSRLTSVTIPASVKNIGNNAFYNCCGLTCVTIPVGMTSIGDYAFAYCTGLTSVTIPAGVSSIGASAFEGCIGLSSITIPTSVSSIGDYTFADCSNLPSITVPEGVTSVGDHTFSNCSSLTFVTVEWATPPSVNTSVFSGVNCAGATLHVPAGTEGLYRTAGAWGAFGTLIEASGPAQVNSDDPASFRVFNDKQSNKRK